MMNMGMTNVPDLKSIANELRKELVVVHAAANAPHIGSDLSCIDILITLYFKVLGKNDHFILSKGHAALALYAVLHKKGIISADDYGSIGKDGSLLAEHPLHGMKGVEVATGSLGHGLSIAAGMALVNKRDNKSGTTYVLLGDGECQEGSIFEAMNFAVRERLNHLVAIVDSNRWQGLDRTLLNAETVNKEFSAAGWTVNEIDGHNFDEIAAALKSNSDAPTLIIANTILGKGIKSMEDKLEWHYRSPSGNSVKDFISEIS